MRTSLIFIASALFVDLAIAAQDQVYRPGAGITNPVVEKEVKPEYPPGVLPERVEGVVVLECVVGTDGTVNSARVIRPLHPSLDAEALRSLAEWRFKPGTKDGTPVPVRIEVEMAFAVRDGEPPPKGPPLDSPDVYKPSANIKSPRILSEVKPQYTAEAMRAKAQGVVRLECVILPDGTVGAVRVNERLHPDLDREAVRALRKWRFVPGFKDEFAVPVQVEVEMAFTLRSTPRNPGGER